MQAENKCGLFERGMEASELLLSGCSDNTIPSYPVMLIPPVGLQAFCLDSGAHPAAGSMIPLWGLTPKFEQCSKKVGCKR